MMDWIVRPAMVAMVGFGLGQIFAPQTIPAPSPDQASTHIRVEASVGPASVYSTGALTTALTDDATTDSTLFVADYGTITDIDVRLRINHPDLVDLDIHLIAPDGTAVKLAPRVGKSGADFGAAGANCSGLMTTFDDDAAGTALAGTAPFLGAYRPDGRLSNYQGRGVHGTWTLRIRDVTPTETGTLYCWQLVVRRKTVSGDWFGNGRSDLVYWRPGAFVVGRQLELEAQSTNGASSTAATDIFVPADFDGNGVVDLAWFRPSTGEWNGVGPTVTWGGASDVPVPGDYNADGIDDRAVWRPSTGTWYVRNQFSWAWGTAGDIPVPGDYNGDGTTDMAVWRPSTGTWYVYNITSVTWGGSGDIPVPADYDGDGRTDFGIWRPATGEWFILTGAGTVMPIIAWGGYGDIPVPADYDNDLRAEFAVWRPSDGTYYIRNVGTAPWGSAGDTPIQKRPAYPGYPY
jgi:subtilisin-like proprotein convertase family protein